MTQDDLHPPYLMSCSCPSPLPSDVTPHHGISSRACERSGPICRSVAQSLSVVSRSALRPFFKDRSAPWDYKIFLQ